MSAPASSDGAASGDDWAAYRTAAKRIAARIGRDDPADRSLAAVHARARRKLDRLGRFLGELDHPERRLRIVHVTGTSGKGSTAAGIAALLSAAGLRTGLATSPYLQVATEKLQLDGRLVSGRDLLATLADIEAAERRWLDANPGEPPLSYGEIWPALALRWFDREQVDIAVLEVAAGGRLDPTNVVRPVASVITSVGLDHAASLGPTLADVAWHKAGIVKPGAPVVVGPLPPEAWPAVEREAVRAGVPVLRAAGQGEANGCPKANRGGGRYGVAVGAEARDVVGNGGSEPVGDGAGDVVGDGGGDGVAPFVVANRRLALAVVAALADRGLLDPHRIDPRALNAARLPGRLEAMPQPPGEPTVVLDGAHNPQKMVALAGELARRRGAGEPPPVVVFGALAGKATAEMLAALAPAAAAFVATVAPVLGKTAARPADLAADARAAGFADDIATDPDPAAALDRGLALADDLGTWVLMTGSLYLLGAVRGRWFLDEAIVRERTPWPAQRPPAAAAATRNTPPVLA